MKNKRTLSTLFLATVLAFSCGKDDLLPDPVNLDYSIVDGDTIKTRFADDYRKLKEIPFLNGKSIVVGDTTVTYNQPYLHEPPLKKPDLSKLKNLKDPDLKDKPLRYVAIGSSLSSGVRDGGYFNEGIINSFPNLIARQMGLVKFEQPLFESTDYNGFGRNIKTSFNPTGGPAPKFKKSQNNLGILAVENSKVTVKKVKKDRFQIDNWARPDISLHGINFEITELTPYSERLNFEIGKSMLNEYTKQKMDVFTMEFCDNIFRSAYPNFDYSRPGGTEAPLLTLLKRYSKDGRKGCIANIPNPSNFPYFKFISSQQLKNGLGGFYLDGISDYFDREGYLVLPSSRMDSIASPKVHMSLKKKPDYSFASIQIINEAVNDYNSHIISFAKETGYPIVDLKSLFEKILSGRYVTEDGVAIDPSYHKGNFFSNDGVYPTALGQAIIANEFIKTLNKHYKMAIPLVPTREYLTIYEM